MWLSSPQHFVLLALLTLCSRKLHSVYTPKQQSVTNHPSLPTKLSSTNVHTHRKARQDHPRPKDSYLPMPPTPPTTSSLAEPRMISQAQEIQFDRSDLRIQLWSFWWLVIRLDPCILSIRGTAHTGPCSGDAAFKKWPKSRETTTSFLCPFLLLTRFVAIYKILYICRL